jgi:hypothetical protein
MEWIGLVNPGEVGTGGGKHFDDSIFDLFI